MSDVTVMGLGKMGSALAEVLLRRERQITVWNRTGMKAEPLVDRGAVLASSAAEAVRASPLVIVCVSHYGAARQFLETKEVALALAGRVLLQLSTGTPREAREMETWARAQGAEYLDGAIAAWPSQMGGDETLVYVSGAEAPFRRHEALLKGIAGGLTYLGEAPANAAVLFAAVLSYLAGHWLGICHGALICEAEGFSVTSFGTAIAHLSPILGADARHMSALIESGSFQDPESTLATAGGDVGRLVEQAEDAGIGSEFPKFAAALFKRAIDAGYGPEEHAALIKVLRTPAKA